MKWRTKHAQGSLEFSVLEQVKGYEERPDYRTLKIKWPGEQKDDHSS